MSWTEARLLSARDPKLRAKLNALMLEKRAKIAEFIDYFNERVGIKPAVPPRNHGDGLHEPGKGSEDSSRSRAPAR